VAAGRAIARARAKKKGRKKGARGGVGREGEGKGDRERELTSGSKSGDHRLQNLGHHGGGRERGGGEEVAARENQMRDRERKEGGRGPERAGSGWVTSRGKNPRHAQPLIEIRFVKRDGATLAIKHNIRQEKFLGMMQHS
jgi:hypothetical protein